MTSGHPRGCPTVCTPSVQNSTTTVSHGLFRGSFERVEEPSRSGGLFLLEMRHFQTWAHIVNRLYKLEFIWYFTGIFIAFMVPKKLKKGDQIRIIAPSDSASIISKERIKFAEQRLMQLGFLVTYGKNVFVDNLSNEHGIQAKVSDFHDAFEDKSVKGIISMIGGLTSHKLLKHIDWNILKKNPKIFCGYSDIDVLALAIYKMTDLITYSGIHFSTFSQKKYFDYSQDYFSKCLMSSRNYKIIPSKNWSDDEWYLNQEKRELVSNEGFWSINPGKAEGKMLGNNVSAFAFLQDAEYLPIIKNTILFLEKDNSWGKDTLLKFERILRALVQTKDGSKIKGLVLGRFTKNTGILKEDLKRMIGEIPELKKTPVIANVDFGHTDPKVVLPVGGKAKIMVSDKKNAITILKH